MSHEVVRSVIDAHALNFVVRVRIVVFNCANRFVVQLRNPLHAMYGAVEQLASGALDAAAAALELETLSHGIDVMVGISSDMLDVEALRLGRLRVAAAATNVRDVLAECVKTSKRDAALVVLHVADDVPAIINVDPLRLRQVFRVFVCVVGGARSSHTCTYTHARARTHTNTHKHTHKDTHTYTSTHTHTYTNAHTNTRRNTRTLAHPRACKRTHAHTLAFSRPAQP